MNKTIEALKLAEEALEGWKEYDTWTDQQMWNDDDEEALAAIREALAEQEKLVPKVSHGLCGGCAKTAADGWALYCVECWEKAEPVKQEPVAWVDAKEEGYEFYGISYLPVGKHHLYAAPVDAKAIRAEALEEAAKVAESVVAKQSKHINDGKPFYANMYWEEIAAAIRGLK